jgi:Flp pilus assembly protein protease CpaA
MIDLILLTIALAGCFVAGAIDLKTTEVPDWIPYAMMGAGILGAIYKSYVAGSFAPILLSGCVGIGYLGFGFMLYYLGQWGGGDAKILSGVGFLIPNLTVSRELFFPFYIGYLFNVFFVGAIYMIAYILVVSFIDRKIWAKFFGDIRTVSRKYLLFALAGFLLLSAAFSYITVSVLGIVPLWFSIKFSLSLLCMVAAMFLLWRFAKTVEEVGFRRKVPVSKLKVGDVLMESKLWEGITKEQLREVKASGKKHVWIKEGVRFTPSFFLAILFTMFLGEGFIWMLGLLG